LLLVDGAYRPLQQGMPSTFGRMLRGRRANFRLRRAAGDPGAPPPLEGGRLARQSGEPHGGETPPLQTHDGET
jgi:hypothetical protein